MKPKYKVGDRVLVSWRFNNIPRVLDPGIVVSVISDGVYFLYQVKNSGGAITNVPEKAISRDCFFNRVIAKLFK